MVSQAYGLAIHSRPDRSLVDRNSRILWVYVDGQRVGPGFTSTFSYRKLQFLSPEPVIECLCYSSSDPGARLEHVEYIIAKSLTRTGAVSLPAWNKNWHDHKQEIATGRVQVLDMPTDKAKEVADLVATTDGIISTCGIGFRLDCRQLRSYPAVSVTSELPKFTGQCSVLRTFVEGTIALFSFVRSCPTQDDERLF